MKTISSFPKVFHIGEDMISNLFKGEIEITEKIDGSQWSFGINEDGETMMRSKGQDLTHQAVPKMFEKAQSQVERMIPILKEKKLKDIIFYCEFLNGPSHNVLKYERIPKNNLYLFGVRDRENFISDYEILWKYADLLDIERVNILYVGELKSVEELDKLLEKDSILGNEKIEGIVVKNYNEPSGKGSYILPISMGKYVGESFKERHKTEWRGSHTSKGRLEIYFDSFRAEARWDKALQHLKENDELENAPRDIGKLMKEIERDLIEEEAENIKEELYKIFINDIIRKARRGVPEWYKEKLVERGFTNEK